MKIPLRPICNKGKLLIAATAIIISIFLISNHNNGRDLRLMKEYEINGMINPYGVESLSSKWAAWYKYEGIEAVKDNHHLICRVNSYKTNNKININSNGIVIGYLSRFPPIDYNYFYRKSLEAGDALTSKNILIETKSKWVALNGLPDYIRLSIDSLKAGQEENEAYYSKSSRKNEYFRRYSGDDARVRIANSYNMLNICLSALSGEKSTDIEHEFEYRSLDFIFHNNFEAKPWKNAYIFIGPSCYTPSKLILIMPEANVLLDIYGIDFNFCSFQNIIDYRGER